MVQASKKSNISLHKIPPEISKEEIPKKRKPSIHITFHNPNSEETTTSFLTKVLAEKLAEEMRKGSCR